MRLLIAFMWLLHWLPLPILGRFGVAVGSLLFIAMPTRRKIALTNLRLCMPELTEAERVTLARQHFQAYSRSVWERSGQTPPATPLIHERFREDDPLGDGRA